MMGIVTECHLDGRRQGMFVLDGIRQAGTPVICCYLLVELTRTRAVENKFEKIPKRLKKMRRNNLRLINH